MLSTISTQLIEWAEIYNDPLYFVEDPISFPKKFAGIIKEKRDGEYCKALKDVEIAAVFASHFAWGRRNMIVRDLERLFDEMQWRPFEYVDSGDWRDEDVSIHRTIKWSEVAQICSNLKSIYSERASLEGMSDHDIRTRIFAQKPDAKAPCKKINLMRRWMVRNDGKVDLGLWTKTDPNNLVIPLDTHVHQIASDLGLTTRKQKDIITVHEITNALAEVFPGDPCKGDFALFGYGVTHQ